MTFVVFYLILKICLGIIFLVMFTMLRFVVVNFSWFVGCICFNHLLQVDDLVGSRPSEYGLAFIGPEGLLWK